ncbi:hypothetical protein SNE35_11365 [Paucibacter sp. R3-3]|uniref:TIGR02285 family protein n=1 Tax=Roseateles agri TaxID=3098619 RepID=A0ABU5DH95_9BURK|nr:hypothetical protein [Paucibacter sp. R3-3]MDY0745113.1 hypothetical protein [Paucibacter sp. R3-3]
MRRSLLIAAGLALTAARSGAQQRQREVRVEQITWLSGASANSPDTETATIEELHQFIEAAWPQVRYATVRANARRAWQMIALGEHVCQPASVRTPEREKIAYFTDTLIGPPQQLIVRRDRLAAVPRNAAGEADLARLLAEGRLRGLLVDGRSYGRGLDALLAAPAGASSPSLHRFSSSDFGSQIFTMLALNRADWSIDFDNELGLQQREEPQLRQLVSLPVAGAGGMVHAGIACPRTPWGLAAIRGIDRAIGTPAGAALLKRLALNALTPEARQQHARQFDEFYRERAKPSVIR